MNSTLLKLRFILSLLIFKERPSKGTWVTPWAHKCSSEDSCGWLFSPSTKSAPGYQIKVDGFGTKPLYLLSHLASPEITFYKM